MHLRQRIELGNSQGTKGENICQAKRLYSAIFRLTNIKVPCSNFPSRHYLFQHKFFILTFDSRSLCSRAIALCYTTIEDDKNNSFVLLKFSNDSQWEILSATTALLLKINGLGHVITE